MVLTREQIMERLQTDEVWVTTSRTNFFSSDVPERKIRYIVMIALSGDGTSSRTVDIEKVKEDDTYEMKFSMVPVAPADHREIPESGYDIENPVIVLEGGTNLSGKASGNSVNTTIIYWDNEI